MTMIIGTAGWSISGEHALHFPDEGTALERYAQRFDGVEVNSSFYRAHRAATWVRWGASVPPGFRFAVKMPRVISHERRLVDCDDALARFLDETSGLGDKLSVLLLQLPPSFAFDAILVEEFLSRVHDLTPLSLVCEPRHPSWFEHAADRALDRLGVARAAADPACVPAAARPGGWRGLAYRRLHGSPRIYRSSYDDGRLDDLAVAIEAQLAAPSWCIFDNTAGGAATSDALALRARLMPAVR